MRGCGKKQRGGLPPLAPSNVEGGDIVPTQSGGDASTHAKDIYGDMTEQHRMAGAGNLIAYKGGKGRRGKKMGGTGLTELAVPAALLYANYAYGRKSRKMVGNTRRMSRKNRYSRRAR
jgi:hypothetical protein